MHNTLVKTACKRLAPDLITIRDQLGQETISTLESGIDLNDNGLALKKALEIFANITR